MYYRDHNDNDDDNDDTDNENGAENNCCHRRGWFHRSQSMLSSSLAIPRQPRDLRG